MVTPATPGSGRLLAVAVGNSRARWGLFEGQDLTPGASYPLAEAGEAIAKAVREHGPELIAVASVNPPAADRIEQAIAGVGPRVVRLGRDLMPLLRHTLTDASTLGMDRACCALAAFDLVASAVAVIDAGTAITVDFVDGEGVFHGGGIAPGVNMMLKSLHEHTAALPDIAFDPHAAGVFGADTRHAMQLGVAAAARGLVRDLVERFAEHYEAYPRVIATGGDAVALFEHDGLVERIIPDLQLIGIQRSVERADEDF